MQWSLKLYVAGNAPKSRAAIAAVSQLCRTALRNRASLEIIDARLHPRRIRDAGVVGLPTLVREAPGPRVHIVGSIERGTALRERLGIDVVPAAE